MAFNLKLFGQLANGKINQFPFLVNSGESGLIIDQQAKLTPEYNTTAAIYNVGTYEYFDSMSKVTPPVADGVVNSVVVFRKIHIQFSID